MKKQNSKTNLLNHSEAKVELLGKYIGRFLNILCSENYTKRIRIYDLFCGQGLYENGGEGSPIVIMRSVKEVFYRIVNNKEVKTKLDCYFNDIKSEKVEKAERSIIEKKLWYPSFGTLKFSSIDYKDYLQNLTVELNELDDEKAFVFIDPYEYKHIKMQHIHALMKNRKTEVLLWLPTQFMYRFEKNSTPKALKDFIEELVPYEKWNESRNSREFVEELRDGFQNAIGDSFFVDNFIIQKDPGTTFALFFFTPHIKGFEKMLESKWEVDNEHGTGWSYNSNQLSLFTENKVNPLAEKLREFLSAKERTNGELYFFTIKQGFLPKHINEILRDWQNTSKIDVKNVDGSRVRRSAFYINYQNYRKNHSRITIQYL